MLHITVRANESYDEANKKFIPGESFDLVLEHSLVSLSKWEAKYEKPFLGTQEKTTEQVLDYLKMMIVEGDLPPEVLPRLASECIDEINAYIKAKMSATWFSDNAKPGSSEIITAELIYYWMFSCGIPVDFERRHLNHLLTLIQVFSLKNAPEEKLSPREAAQRQRDLNRQRRAQYGTKG